MSCGTFYTFRKHAVGNNCVQTKYFYIVNGWSLPFLKSITEEEQGVWLIERIGHAVSDTE